MRVLAIVVMVLLGLMAVAGFAVGFLVLGVAKETDSALHEVEAFVALVGGTGALAGFGVTAAVLSLRRE